MRSSVCSLESYHIISGLSFNPLLYCMSSLENPSSPITIDCGMGLLEFFSKSFKTWILVQSCSGFKSIFCLLLSLSRAIMSLTMWCETVALSQNRTELDHKEFFIGKGSVKLEHGNWYKNSPKLIQLGERCNNCTCGSHHQLVWLCNRTWDSIGPTLHFWYSILHWPLFCKCNARCCLTYLLQMGQFDMVIECVGCPMPAMVAYYIKWNSHISVFNPNNQDCNFHTKQNYYTVIFGTATNISYITIVLFTWSSFYVYYKYRHDVFNKNWP